MWQVFKDSLLHPKMIGTHMNYKHKVLYFILLCVLLVVPNIVYTSVNGVIDKSYLGVVNNGFYEEEMDFELIDGKLVGEQEYIIQNDYGCIAVSNVDNNVSDNEIAGFFSLHRDVSLGEYNFLFTNSSIKIITVQAGMLLSFDLGNYSDFTNENINFKIFKTDRSEFLKFVDMINNIYNQYKSKLLLISIPTYLVSSIISFLIQILFPVLLLFLFNRGVVRFKEMFALGVMAYTPYVILFYIGLLFGGMFSYIGDFISLIYLFIAFINYVRMKSMSRGEDNEL